jgi:membrane-associated phospholipid phosphatase
VAEEGEMRVSRREVLKLGGLTLASGGLGAFGLTCSEEPDDSAALSPSDVASSWFELLYDIVKAERTTPPLAARVYGVAAVALYESVRPGAKAYRSLAGQLNGLTSVPKPHGGSHWPSVANSAMAEAVRGLYPALSEASRAGVEALEQRFVEQAAESESAKRLERSHAYGSEVARAILDWAQGDGIATNAGAMYVPARVEGAWEPTPPQFSANPLEPGWGELRPMVLASGNQLPPAGHPAFSVNGRSDFYAAAREVYDVGVSLTAEEKLIADYWADGPGSTGTPPGHWTAITSQIARNDGLSLVAAAEAFARVGIALSDAFICCWNSKYAFNLQRPVTYINKNINATWRPYIATPSFPAYTSGHSTQSGAAAFVLTDLFGEKGFTDTTHQDHSLMPRLQPRSFRSFEEAAAEAAISRLYGGIHYSFDNDDGLAVGRALGEAIVSRVTFRAG